MTLLSITQSVAKDLGLAVPFVLVSSTDETARRLLAQAQKAGKSLMRWPHPKGGWAALQTEYTFPTVAAQADYDLPSDFRSMIDGTLWDRSQYWELRGPLTPQEWQALKSSAIGNGVVGRRWRIRNVSGAVKFSIDPTPSASTAGQTLVLEYRSQNWCKSSGGTGRAAWAADTDTGVVDEYLIELETVWRMLERLGLSYLEAKEEAENEIRQAIARDCGMASLRLDGPRIPFRPLGNPTTPETGFGS